VLELSLPLFLVVIFLPLALFLFYLEVSTESSKLSYSIVTVLQASQVTFVFYQPLSSTTAVLLNFSGCGCLLPTKVQRVYQDLFKFNGLYSALFSSKFLLKVYSSLKQLFKVISSSTFPLKSTQLQHS
jgi:hypothetical protein